MAKFLTTRGTTSEIENIINNASKSLVLITPYVKIPDSLFQNLKARDQQGIRVTLVHRKRELAPEVEEKLKQLRNMTVCYLENLHAKCYFNEQSMVITSLNLYDFSEQNNREMGILITKQEDEEVFKEANAEAKRIIGLANRLDLAVREEEQTSDKKKPPQKTAKEPSSGTLLQNVPDVFRDILGLSRGYCISCRARIDYDEYRPYCSECYKKRARQKNQKASYCHACGRKTTTSLQKPVCLSCFKKTAQYR
jgi:hypothetical protein